MPDDQRPSADIDVPLPLSFGCACGAIHASDEDADLQCRLALAYNETICTNEQAKGLFRVMLRRGDGVLPAHPNDETVDAAVTSFFQSAGVIDKEEERGALTPDVILPLLPFLRDLFPIVGVTDHN